jgi:hypothetical protein
MKVSKNQESPSKETFLPSQPFSAILVDKNPHLG